MQSEQSSDGGGPAPTSDVAGLAATLSPGPSGAGVGSTSAAPDTSASALAKTVTAPAPQKSRSPVYGAFAQASSAIQSAAEDAEGGPEPLPTSGATA